MNLSLQAYPFFQKNSNTPIDRLRGGGGRGSDTGWKSAYRFSGLPGWSQASCLKYREVVLEEELLPLDRRLLYKSFTSPTPSPEQFLLGLPVCLSPYIPLGGEALGVIGKCLIQ